MGTVVGTFLVNDSFRITGRGLVLVGGLTGDVATGHQLIFENGTRWGIKGVDFVNFYNRYEKLGLLVDAPLATHEELAQRGIIGAVAQIITP